MHSVSTNQIADILYFNNKSNNSTAVHILIHEDKSRIFSEKSKINLRIDKNAKKGQKFTEDTKHRQIFYHS